MTGNGLYEAVFFATVRIQTTGPTGAGVGTGFLAAHAEGNSGRIFLVTNKHVIAGATNGTFFFIARKPDGSPDIEQRREFTVHGFASA